MSLTAKYQFSLILAVLGLALGLAFADSVAAGYDGFDIVFDDADDWQNYDIIAGLAPATTELDTQYIDCADPENPDWNFGYARFYQVEFTQPVIITHLRMYAYGASNQSNNRKRYWQARSYVGWGGELIENLSWENNTQGWVEFGFDTSASIASKYWILGTYLHAREWPCHTIQHNWIAIDYIAPDAPPADWETRPLQAADEYSNFGAMDKPEVVENVFDYSLTFNWGENELLNAVSAEPGAYVHAIAPGTVKAIRPLSVAQDCAIFDVNPGCYVLLYDSTELLVRYFDEGYIVDVELQEEGGDHWQVTYIVNDPDGYVGVGDTVAAGCVLGVTIPLKPINTPFIATWLATANAAYNVLYGEAYIPAGFTEYDYLAAVWDASTTLGWAGVLAFNYDYNQVVELNPSVYPGSSTPCNALSETGHCLNFNPTFLNGGEGWSDGGQTTYLGSGKAQVGIGDKVYQSMLLSSEATYSVTAEFEGTWEDIISLGYIFVSLGTETYDYPAVINQKGGHSTLADVTPSASQVYNVGFELNSGATYVTLTSLCVTDGETTIPPPEPDANSCYFENPYFDDGLDSWQTSNFTADINNGYVTTSVGNLAQNVHLAPAEPVNYNIGVRLYNMEIDPTYSGTQPEKVRVRYEWPIGESLVEVGTTLVADLVEFPASVTKSFTVANETDSDFKIYVDLLDSADQPIGVSDLLDVNVTTVCLSTTDEIADTCASQIERPDSSDDFGGWIYYHWRSLDAFFNCQLMPFLSEQYRFFVDQWNVLSMVLRWLIAAAQDFAGWMSLDLFPWLQSYFDNFGQALYSLYYPGTMPIGGSVGGGDGTNFWDVLVALFDNIGLLGQAISGVAHDIIAFLQNIFDTVAGLVGLLLSGLIALLITIVTKMFYFLGFVQDIILAIFNGYVSASPSSLPGLPDCGLIDPRNHPLCTAIWVIDNTVFEDGGTGRLMIPLIVSFGSISLLIWVATELKKTIIKTGGLA